MSSHRRATDRLLALWLPDWPTQRWFREWPELAGQALVLVERDPRYGDRVRACSEAARRQGVRPGMPLAEVRSQPASWPAADAARAGSRGQGSARLGAGRGETGPRGSEPAEEVIGRGEGRRQGGASPKLGAGRGETGPRGGRADQGVAQCPCHVDRYEPERDREALRQLAEWCEQFSPLVGLDAEDQPDGLLLDIRGIGHLFGGEAALCQSLLAGLAGRGLAGRVAVAGTVGAAWAMARWQPPGDPPPCRILEPGDTAALDKLPLELLRLPEDVVQSLRRLGIADRGGLRRMGRAGLAARFGELLLSRLDQLSGAAPEVIVAHRPRPALELARRLESPVEDREAVERICELLLQQLAQRLQQQGQGVLRLRCQLSSPDQPPWTVEVGLYQPTADAGHLASLLRMQLEQRRLPGAVEEVRVVAESTAPRGERQADLFGGAVRGSQAQLGGLIERLSGRLGRQRVVAAQLQAEAQPERAVCWVPLTGESTRREAANCSAAASGKVTASGKAAPSRKARSRNQAALAGDAATGGGALAAGNLLPAGDTAPRANLAPDGDPAVPAGPWLRPLRILDPPQPIEVLGIAVDGPPAVFSYRRQRYRVAKSFGPERIETGWWRGPSCRRDYYRVETERGHRWWLFRDLQDQRWYVQGEFA